MNKILIITGPTATGKTSLALKLACLFGGEIVSADSRQVYIGFDIGTGKDIPRRALRKESPLGVFYEIKGVKVWGYDLVSPKEEFSVAQYAEKINRIIKEIQGRGKLPILVGGTGFYIKAVIDGVATAIIPRNPGLRQSLADKTPDQLFENLAQIDASKAASLNSSDKKNPRRLVRAIEVAMWKLDNADRGDLKTAKESCDALFIGLNLDNDRYEKILRKRVIERLRKGLLREIKVLLKKGVSWDSQAMSSLGYKQWRGFFAKEKGKKETIESWYLAEKKYAKRQITWFKKEKRIVWFNPESTDYPESVEKLIQKWYKKGYAEKN
jgi:tRNA dimethylallyltransferase